MILRSDDPRGLEREPEPPDVPAGEWAPCPQCGERDLTMEWTRTNSQHIAARVACCGCGARLNWPCLDLPWAPGGTPEVEVETRVRKAWNTMAGLL
jgi:Zn ribbon nucleic-acid-binding protein